MLRIGLAEEHRIPRRTVRDALAKSDELEIVGEAATLPETIAMIERTHPDLLVVEPQTLYEAMVEKLAVVRDASATSTLTARELEIMELLARGLTSREIAHDLRISIKTVDTHRAHLLAKLRLRNNAELARFAVKHGYIAP